MAQTTKLLDSDIYEVKEVWAGPDTLQQANYALRTLLKGLRFLRVVPLSVSPNVMGLMGIHDLDALYHFNGMTHCTWCRKEGQNEGTVINHLCTVHYRLSLVSINFQLPVCLIGHPLPPEPVELPTLIFIHVTTSRRCMRSIYPKWEPGWRT